MESKNMNIIETLISEVAKRPLLWDRYDNDYNNRSAMDCEWDTISELLKKDKDFVKQKWRNLRDQFQRESKKVKVPFDNPTKPYIQYYRGKWMYFEHMLFLKDPTAKRSSSCNSPPVDIDLREDDIKEEVIVFEDDIFSEHVNSYNDETENNERASVTSPSDEVTQSTVKLKVEAIENDLENEQLEVIGRKRKASRSESAIAVKSKSPSAASATANTEDQSEIDEDLHFVKSLVPYLRTLSPIRKLLVRNEIQSLLIRESLCSKCKFGKNSDHK